MYFSFIYKYCIQRNYIYLDAQMQNALWQTYRDFVLLLKYVTMTRKEKTEKKLEYNREKMIWRRSSPKEWSVFIFIFFYILYQKNIRIVKLFDFRFLMNLNVLECPEHDFTMLTKFRSICLSVCEKILFQWWRKSYFMEFDKILHLVA